MAAGKVRNLLILITAFTIGHSITLALSSTGTLRISTSAIEFLIPVSIFITALMHWFEGGDSGRFPAIFGLTGMFGLLHGLGFANTLRQMLGKEDALLLPLFGFNLGVEAGQILILALILMLHYLLRRLLPDSESRVVKPVLILVMLGSIWMIWQRMPF